MNAETTTKAATDKSAAPSAQKGPGGNTPRVQQQMRGKRPRRKSQYGTQLQEKQDLKSTFNIREEQLRKYYREAKRAGGQTGDNLVVLLERRLDNAIFRSGFAQTRKQARQMATHRFFQVNNRSVDVPSHLLRPGDEISVRPGKQSSAFFTNFEKRVQNARTPSWIELTPKEFSFKVVSLPTAEEAALGVDMRAIVELFAR